MSDKLSSFFIKVQAVEEFFLQLNGADRERAITILSSSIKKLQTLLECTTDVPVISESLKSTNDEAVFDVLDHEGDEAENIDDIPISLDRKPKRETRRSCRKKIKLETKEPKENNKRQTRNSKQAEKIASKEVEKNVLTKCLENILTSTELKTAEKQKQKSETKSSRRIFDCGECHVTLTHPRAITNHIESHGKQPLCCLNCKTECVNLQAFQFHMCTKSYSYKQKKYACSECGLHFRLKKLLKHHLDTIHNVRLKKIKCSYCDLKFSKKSSMFGHLRVHAEGKMVCMKCGQFCDDFASFSDHMSNHDKEANFKCNKCAQTFMKIQQYKQHMSGHEKYNCSQCVQSFSCNDKLKKHEKEKHDLFPSEDTSYICDVCGKMFSSAGQLEVHQRLHTGEKPLECSICKVSFRTKRALLKHKETYSHCTRAGISKERHFLCCHCGKSFFRKQTLRRHLRCHSGDRPHICQYCGYKTSELNNLKRHALHHFKGLRNFICELCGEAFHTKKTLASHHNHRHNEERNFNCMECDMTFKSKSGLNRHIKTHSKFKEHVCWCDAAFGRLSNLRRHMRSVHGSDSALPPVRKIAVLDETEPSEEMEKSLSDKLVEEKYDESHLGHSLQDQTIMVNCLQMPETYQSQHCMTSHMTLDTQGMVYDNMASAQSLVGYHNTQHVGVDHQRPPDYYPSNMSIMDNMAASHDYNNPCMYIQNVLLPSVEGLLDLSHSGK